MSRILPEDLCREAAGKPYRPSNGTEGDIFEEHFCNRCRRMRIDPNAANQCGIYLRMGAYEVDDKKYPKQVRYAPDGSGPECTSFRLRGSNQMERAAKLRKHLTP